MAWHLDYCGRMSRPPGRPPLGDRRRGEVIRIRLSEAELAHVRQLAGDQTVAAWIRALVTAA